ncbi:16458_t:CDS:2 [Funneliformis geosporum]|uniref:3704_t:CDS:1 n=1 Tax=Funneliformis geosporum TaxID=1117311 RepID=A0A9W4WT90_9GLOM|nr:16458_t:CDS:2 [Funneliformis geosporum]CAI2170465.1 3704_t:CDS:2 [Funneliformis geosporum]
MQRLPPAGWSRHLLFYLHRCKYCSPNSNPREYTRQISQLSNPSLPMPEPTYEPFHFPDSHNSSAKYNERLHSYASLINITDENIEKVSPMNNPSWWRQTNLFGFIPIAA